MTTEIKEAIKLLSNNIKGDLSADDALKYTQAALNLAHTAATLSAMTLAETREIT